MASPFRSGSVGPSHRGRRRVRLLRRWPPAHSLRVKERRVIEGFELPPGWPRMSLAQVDALLTAPGARFAIEEAMIRGLPTRIWKNAPPTLPVLLAHSRGHGDRTAWILEDERVSFDATYRAAVTLAAEMRRLGIGKGDRVAIAMANLPEWPVTFFAATALGAIAVPLNAWWAGGELTYGLADSGAKLLVADGAR